MRLLSVQLWSEILFGAIFVVWGIACIVLNKEGGKLYASFQRGWGLKESAFAVGRFISIFGGGLFVIIGLMMLFVPHR